MEATDREQRRKRRPVALFFAVLAIWLVVGALGVAFGVTHWFVALLLGAAAVLAVVNVAGRLMGAPEPRDSDDLLTPPERGDRRIRCPCCGSPSLDPTIPDQSCPACEWLVDGLPGEDVPPPEEIAAARDNFRRFLSVYPPDARPEWSPDPPSEDELALRRELIELYARALTEPEERGIWWEIEKLEGRIKDLELAYSEEVEARAGDELEEEDEAAEDEPQEEEAVEDPEPQEASGSGSPSPGPEGRR